MKTPVNYRLTKTELARQIHRMICEIYSGCSVNIDDIINNLKETKSGITFQAKKFAKEYYFDILEFIQKLYIELGIEFEKNLHDKFYFMMTKDDTSLHFRIIESEEK